MARIIKLKKKKPTDEGSIPLSKAGGKDEVGGTSSKTDYENNLKKKYVDTFNAQPVKPGNYYDEDTRKNTSTHMSNEEIEESLKIEGRANAVKKKKKLKKTQ